MLKIDKTEVHTVGNTQTLISELGALTHHISKMISERTGIPVRDIKEEINNITSMYTLIDTGMTIQEASEVIMPGKLHKVIEINPDGEKNEIILNEKRK